MVKFFLPAKNFFKFVALMVPSTPHGYYAKIPVPFTLRYRNRNDFIFFQFIREFPLPLLRGTIELGSYLTGSAATLCTRSPLGGEKWRRKNDGTRMDLGFSCYQGSRKKLSNPGIHQFSNGLTEQVCKKFVPVATKRA